MRASIIAAVPFVAAALAQDTTSTGATEHTTVIAVNVNGTTTSMSTYTYFYDNPQTAFLTETNSDGVVTGMPAAATGTVPTAAASIPAGLPVGLTSIPLNISGTVTYFPVSVGSSTTLAIGGAATVEGNSIVPTGTDSSNGAQNTGSGSGNGNGNGNGSNGNDSGSDSPSNTSSGSESTPTGNAAVNVKIGSAGVFGLGAFMAALL